MNMNSYSLYMKLPDSTARHCLGTLPANRLAELDVCLLSCVSLLCGLQDSTGRPRFTLHYRGVSGYTTTAATLEDHTKGWMTEDGEPFTVEAL
jgi:hypothetical protein